MDKLIEVLEANKAEEYENIHHDRQLSSAQEGAEFFGIETGQTAPALVVKSEDAYLAVILSGDYGRIDLQKKGGSSGLPPAEILSN